MIEQQRSTNPFVDGSAIVALRGLPSFEEALSRLMHTAEHGRAFGIVRGPCGSGKSLLLQSVASESRRAGHECGQIDLRRCDADEFSWRLACELGAAPSSMDRRSCWRLVDDTITGRALASRVTTLLLDHLEAASEQTAEEVRRLLCLAEASAGWCSVLAAGEEHSPVVYQIADQYAELRIELGSLEVDETRDLLRRVAGMTGCPEFTQDAVAALQERTAGLLRDVLRLSRLALFACDAEEATEVSDRMVIMVAGETLMPQRRRFTLAEHAPLPASASRAITAET